MIYLHPIKHRSVGSIIMAALMSGLLLTSGCASTSKISRLGYGEPLAIKVATDSEKTSEIKVSNKAVGEMTGDLALGGAAAGAISGLTCGPFFWICSPLGMAAGAIVGSSAGLVVGVAMDLDNDTEKRISDKVTALLAKHAPGAQIDNHLQSQARAVFAVSETPTSNLLNVKLIQIALHSNSDNGISLYIKAEATLETKAMTGDLKTYQDTFEIVTPSAPVDSWRYGDDYFYELMFSSAYQAIAQKIVQSLMDQDKQPVSLHAQANESI